MTATEYSDTPETPEMIVRREQIGEYKCVHAYTAAELNKLVNSLIIQGWQPFGPVSTSSYCVQEDGVLEPGTWTVYAQAMVRYVVNR